MELPEAVDDALVGQSGVVARRQVVAAGLRDSDIRRLLRRRRWATVHAGVYVEHTGPLTWEQRAWAAVLSCWPAALAGESAIRGDQSRRDATETGLIHVAVDHRRTVVPPTGVRVHRRHGLDDLVQWNLSPPRLRYEEAALDVALDADGDLAAIGVVARAVQSRRTTARRLLIALDARARVSRRSWLRRVLTDVAEGTCSVLEHEYLTRVERPHGLPRARRQHRVEGSLSLVYRDVEYAEALVIELDGRLFHDTAAQRDRDLERDLDAAVDALETRRLSWGQVHGRACSTAAKLALILRRRGWNGTPHGCGPGCPVETTFRRRTA
jgi:hypothetical protein